MTLFLTIALMQWIALMLPGPDFFFTSQIAISRSRKEAMMGVLGITTGVLFWAGITLTGLHLLLQKMVWIQKVIAIGGGIYLLWMGLQLFRSAWRHHKNNDIKQSNAVDLPTKIGASFIKGLLTNLSNPKAIIYFGSIFSLSIGDNISALGRLGLLLLISFETLVWFTFVVTIFCKPWIRNKYYRCAKWIDALAGTTFTAFGLHLLNA